VRSAEFAPRASVEPTIEISDTPESEAAPLLSADLDGEASEIVSAEDLGAELVSDEVVSAKDPGAEVVSAEIASAGDLGAEVVSAEVAGADDASSEGSATMTEPAKEPAVATDDETVGSSKIEIPDFRSRGFGRATVAVFVGCAALLVVAGVAWNRVAHRGEHSGIAGRVPERAPEPVPAPANPQRVPSSATPATNTTTTTSALTPDEPVGKSNEKANATVTVTVKAFPEGAVIFQAGKRLGTGVVRVSVEPKVKQRFTALLDGYAPSNFTLDGSRDSVTILLKRAQKRRVTTTVESDSPYDGEPTADTTAVAAPAPTAAPAPESTTDGAVAPEVPNATR
jgi:hypothetical protein